MASSDPKVKQRILTMLRRGGPQKVIDNWELRNRLGMTDVSQTQFDRALGSLVYKSQQVNRRRDEPVGISTNTSRTFWAMHA